jgi:hypothetical protein
VGRSLGSWSRRKHWAWARARWGLVGLSAAGQAPARSGSGGPLPRQLPRGAAGATQGSQERDRGAARTLKP